MNPARRTSARKILIAATTTPPGVIRGIARYSHEHDWHLITDMVMTGIIPSDWQADGVIASLPSLPEVYSQIAASGLPCVTLSTSGESDGFCRVETDNKEIGRIAAEHLLERAHRSFAWAPFFDNVENEERLGGFRARLAEHGCTCVNLPPTYSVTASVRQHRWTAHRDVLVGQLAGLPRPTAVFAFNDSVAADIVDACREAGLSVPEDIAVLGVGNSIICTTSAVSLSSVDVDTEEIGYRAAALLNDVMRQRTPVPRVVRVSPKGVVTRVSTDLVAVKDPRVARALTYIAEHYPHPELSVASVADAVGMSRRNLERSFRHETGSTIHDHIINVRMREASRLLRTFPNTKNSAVAALVGLAGERTFFRIFRRHFGVSPKAHREWTAEAHVGNRSASTDMQSLRSSDEGARAPHTATRSTAA
jgi:LacI family transcriptional regulator